MKLNDFLKQHSLGEKEISLEGIDEKFKIRQLSMTQQLEIMERNNIELGADDTAQLSIEMIKRNANFRKDVIFAGLVSPKIDEKTFNSLNQEGLNLFSQLADEILRFTNQAPKQESKED